MPGMSNELAAGAAVVILRQLAEAGPVRSGELAARLEVEAPHVTRQVQRLQQAGYVDRVPDPDDRRAQLIQLTPSGMAASDRIREAGTSGMQAALAHWPPQELHQLATLLHRMVDDFLAYSAEEEHMGRPSSGPMLGRRQADQRAGPGAACQSG